MFSENAFLSSLPHSAALQLKAVNLPADHTLYEPGDTVSSVYFPCTAMVSMVVPLEDRTIQAAAVGRNGIVGALSALQDKPCLTRAVVHSAGMVMMCPAGHFRSAALQSVDLLSAVLRFEHGLLAQSHQMAACNLAHNLKQRFARWLLLARDLTGQEELHFKQETVAEMLGVGRTTLCVCAHELSSAGAIKYARGIIKIVDEEALSSAACECYETMRLMN
jgi:CRP-like cAMP-binding protein